MAQAIVFCGLRGTNRRMHSQPRFNSGMLFFLRKLAEAVMLPVGFCGLLMLIAIVLRRRRIAIAALVLAYVLGTELAGVLLLSPLEHAYPAIPVAAAPEADAIVVLAGGSIRDINPAGLQWGNSANRFFAGVALAKAQKAKLLVLSSGLTLRYGRLLRDAALQDGIDPARIVVTQTALTTQEESGVISAIPGIHSILLVTSAFHMPRAVLLFRSRGLQVSPFPTDQHVPVDFRPGLMGFVPSPAGLTDAEMALREYYGLAVYRTFPVLRGASPRLSARIFTSPGR